MLTADELEAFERDGIVKIPAAFATEDAARMRDVLWSELTARHFTTIRDEVLRSDAWFRNLTSADERSVDPMDEADLDGLPVRVIELTGRAGDVYVTHPCILHSIATNVRHTTHDAQPLHLESAATSRSRRTGSSVKRPSAR